MRILRLFLVIMLAGSLGFTSAISSYAKGLSAGSTTLVICSDVGERAIVLGANGEEIPVLHACIDCCISAAIPLLPTVDLPVPTRVFPVEFAQDTPAVSPDLWRLNKDARGPPVLG